MHRKCETKRTKIDSLLHQVLVPVVENDFLDIINEYKELFSSLPGIAAVEGFHIRTGNAGAVKFLQEWYLKLITKKLIHKLRKR